MNASDQWGAIFRTFSSQSQSEYGSLTMKGFICSELSPQKNYYNGGCWSFYIYSIMINLMNATLSYLKTDCLLILFLAWFLPSFSFHHLISLNWKSIIIPQHNSDISSDLLNSLLLDAFVFFIRSISCAFNTKVVSKTNSKKVNLFISIRGSKLKWPNFGS